MPRAKSAAFGLGLAVLVAVIAQGLITLAGACMPVEVIEAADTGDQFFECMKKPIPFCDAMALGAGGCTGDPTAKSPVVRELPTNVSYPLGCVANVIEPIAGNDCRVAATCRCVAVAPDAGEDAGEAPRPGWSCFP